jgi:hypothetical protein
MGKEFFLHVLRVIIIGVAVKLVKKVDDDAGRK